MNNLCSARIFQEIDAWFFSSSLYYFQLLLLLLPAVLIDCNDSRELSTVRQCWKWEETETNYQVETRRGGEDCIAANCLFKTTKLSKLSNIVTFCLNARKLQTLWNLSNSKLLNTRLSFYIIKVNMNPNVFEWNLHQRSSIYVQSYSTLHYVLIKTDNILIRCIHTTWKCITASF